ncbi:hypothetical protein GALMADRAFT_55557 [Galerina marginata CBS 339.88]|uniref:PEBP-like protein n=1 Tax=Galerina marginata (strain CBS 339.88) TaxID=685588 RepID=A0A067TVE3_GALM3|nr:hypothetical protein GALMADRAFT_55557 [Galerina marginata CBS 339.88]
MSFVVALVDPDAPTPQNRSFAEFLHFLGGDFSADMTSGLLSNNSPALMEFTPPAPPAGSDPHRYVLLVFNQPDTFDTDAPMFINASAPRNNFNVASFAQNVSLGNPIAGNYFLVGPMDSSAGPSSIQMASATDQQPTPTAPFSIPADPSLTTFDTSPPAAVTAPSTTPSTSRGNSNKKRLKGPEIIVMTFMVILTSL